MSEETKTKAPTETAAPAGKKQAWSKSVLVQRWLAVIIVGSVVAHLIVFALFHKSAARSPIQGEYTVGTFAFIEGQPNNAPATTGKFDLHVRFIDDLDTQARQRIATHQYRVREGIEGLLRNSQGMELNDSALARLKHDIQEKIDEALDLRAVAEVLMTDWTISPATASSSAQPAATNAATGAIPTAIQPASN